MVMREGVGIGLYVCLFSKVLLVISDLPTCEQGKKKRAV